MRDEDFIEQITARPGDDDLKLVYADWLDEIGDLRGQLIRLSVEMRRVMAKADVSSVPWLRLLQIQEERPVVRRFGVDFKSEGGALTLPVSAVSESEVEGGRHSRSHDSGWTIVGEVHEDYFTWVNDFEAAHETLGRVWGNFENEVYADSVTGFNNFYSSHPPEPWDYGDI